MVKNYELYKIRIDKIKKDDEEKKNIYKETIEEISEAYEKIQDAINGICNETGVSVSNKEGKFIIEKHGKQLDYTVEGKITRLCKKLTELSKAKIDLEKKIELISFEFPIKRTNLRREMQLTLDDYLSGSIDNSLYTARDEERIGMANLLNNFEFVHKIHDLPIGGAVHHAAIVTRYYISDGEQKIIFGVADLITGEIILPLTFTSFNSAEYTYDDLYFPRTAKAWGIKPNEDLENKYDKVIYSNVAIVSKNGKYGICDMDTGDTIVPCNKEIEMLPTEWEELENRETSPNKESPYSDIKNKLLNQYKNVSRVGQVYFVTNDTRFIDGVMGHEAQGPYGVYSAISGNEIIPTNLDLTFYGCKEVYKELGCPTEPVDETDLYDAVKRVNEKGKIKKN